MITVVCIARARTATEETFKWAMQRKALMLSSAHVRVVVGLLTIQKIGCVVTSGIIPNRQRNYLKTGLKHRSSSYVFP